MEDFEDMVDDDKGFHFFGGAKAQPVAAPKRPSMGGLDFKSVKPVNKMGGAGFQ